VKDTEHVKWSGHIGKQNFAKVFDIINLSFCEAVFNPVSHQRI
jgi:hypothetical protein